MYYKKHIFFCNNQKADGKKCCAQGNAEEMRNFTKEKLAEWGVPLGEHGIRITLSGCLGRCSEGPNIVIYPEGVWYHYQNQADVEKILKKHILEGQIVEELTI